jgi:phage/plasmid-associated DNA primase
MTDIELRGEANFMASVSGAGAGMGTPAANNQPPISGTLDLVRCATRDYRATDMYTLEDLADEARAQAIAAAVLTAAGATGELYNSVRSPGLRLPLPRYKMTLEIASVLITATEDVAVLDFGDGDEGLYIYSRTGPHAGTWTHAQAGGLDIIRRILGILGVRQAEQGDKAVARQLYATALRLAASRNPDLLAFKDGVLDYSHGKLSFTSYLDKNSDANATYTSIYGKEAYLTHKANIDWKPMAALPVFTCNDGTEWNPMEHIRTATGRNEDAMTILLQSVIFLLKGTSGDGVLWFMDGTMNGSGGGGKSTTGDILASIVGKEQTCYINLESIADGRFNLGKIVGKTYLFGNETSAGNKAIERADQIKALMRGEPVEIEEKYKDPYSYTFHGVWVQCMNCEAPKFMERENALYRRVIPVYFPQSFTHGMPEKPEIKNLFAKDPRVGEYLAAYALQKYGNIDRYDPDAVARLREKLKDIREAGSTAFEFLSTYAPEIKNRATPVGMIYKFYAQWVKTNGYGFPLGLKSFKREVQQWTATNPGWTYEHRDSNNRAKTGETPVAETYMTENPIPGYADYSGYTCQSSAFMLSARLKDHRDRDWLVQESGRVIIPDEEERLYSAYRAAALAAYVDTGAGAAGIPVGMFLLTKDEWVSAGRIAPEYTAPISRPDARGFWARSGGNVIVISQEEYARAVRKARKDPALLNGYGRFFKAARMPG